MNLEVFLIFAQTCKSGFFGLVPWYQYLKVDSKTCEVAELRILPQGGHSDLPLIMAAIVDDLLRIAGFIAVVFVIVGAIQYITSDGNPESAGKAKDTIINALIGLAVATVGVSFISFVGHRLS